MYQLLISPSVVSYLVHDQFFYFVPPVHRLKKTLIDKIRATVYILGIKEWNMNTGMSYYLWAPFKSVGRVFAFMDKPRVQAAAFAVFLAAAVAVTVSSLSNSWLLAVSTTAAVASLILYMRAFTTKNTATVCWNLIMLGHLFGALFLGLASLGSWQYLIMYGTGVAVAFLIGHACLRYVRAKSGEPLALRDNSGLIYPFRRTGTLFFIVCLLFMAFPISPSFLAQDILLSFIPTGHVLQIALFILAYLVMGVSVMRLYTKVFFGPHNSKPGEIAYKSS
jgi:NADH-quinone oxidoreductase subunit L